MVKSIVVFGASGEVGLEVIKQASEKGFNVLAVVRDAKKIDVKTLKNVRVVEGDLKDATFVESCIEGQDFIVSSLGFRKTGMAFWNKPLEPEFLKLATENIVRAMRKLGGKRACVVSAAGVGDSYAKVSLVFHLIIKLSVLSKVFPLLEEMENTYLESGDLDVSIVRPVGLTQGPMNDKAVTSDTLYGAKSSASVSRANVAKWILEEGLGAENVYRQKKPMLAEL